MLNSVYVYIIDSFKGMLKSIEYVQMKRAETARKYWSDRWYCLIELAILLDAKCADRGLAYKS